MLELTRLPVSKTLGPSLVLVLLALSACRHEEPQFTAHQHGADDEAECENPTPPPIAEAEDEAPGPRPLRTADDGSRVFGRELQDGIETVTLSAISADPPSFTDHVVRTEGDRKSTRLNSSHNPASRMPSSA
jgi:hypothetical protein